MCDPRAQLHKLYHGARSSGVAGSPALASKSQATLFLLCTNSSLNVVCALHPVCSLCLSRRVPRKSTRLRAALPCFVTAVPRAWVVACSLLGVRRVVFSLSRRSRSWSLPRVARRGRCACLVVCAGRRSRVPSGLGFPAGLCCSRLSPLLLSRPRVRCARVVLRPGVCSRVLLGVGACLVVRLGSPPVAFRCSVLVRLLPLRWSFRPRCGGLAWSPVVGSPGVFAVRAASLVLVGGLPRLGRLRVVVGVAICELGRKED